MSAPVKYLIAKYIPELMRNEPLNFGVIVATPFKTAARFLGERADGSIDGRKIPDWVNSKRAYKEWVYFWRNSFSKTKATVEECIEFLKQTSNANYVLGDQGSVLDEIAENDVSSLRDYLFDVLVEKSTDAVSAKYAYDLARACNQIIKKTRVADHVLRNKGIYCNIGHGVSELFQFDYYFGNGNGKPEWLSKRVPLGTQQLEKQVHSAAWEFEKIISAQLIPQERSAALIMPTEKQREDEEVRNAISVLQTVTRVIDLGTEPERLERELNELPEVSKAGFHQPFTE